MSSEGCYDFTGRPCEAVPLAIVGTLDDRMLSPTGSSGDSQPGVGRKRAPATRDAVIEDDAGA